MRVLVTGGLGYIGSHTVVELMEAGHTPIIIDDLSNSREEVLDGIAMITGRMPVWHRFDIRGTHQLKAVLQAEEIDAVIHFAAYKAVGESVEKPMEYFDNNVGGMLSLLKAMKATSCKKLVFSSSCTVYGDSSNSPIDENEARVKAISPYGTTKIICEEIIEDLAAHDNFHAVSLRYFNPVGAHPSAQIGELPLGVPNNLVPYITQTAAGIRERLTIFGKDYPTPDGTNIRDFIHVVDLASAHVKALDRLDQSTENLEYFNLGTGKGHSVLEVVKSFEKVSGLELNYSFGERRAGDVVQIWADPAKAKTLLGWEAEYSLDQMMETAWAWQRSLKNK